MSSTIRTICTIRWLGRLPLIGCLSLSAMSSSACNKSPLSGANAVEAQQPKPALGQGTPEQNLTNAYLVVQAKLASDDYAAAHAAFGAVHNAVRSPRLTIAADLRDRIDAPAVAGGAGKDLAALRKSFGALSDALLAWFAVQTNPLGDELSVAHCPMAFDGKGAKWLQIGDAVRNPYYGTEMLTCGSVDAKLSPGKKL